jgi:hypothetical protein
MLQGKQFARGVRGMKVVFEAMFRLFYAALEDWLSKQDKQLRTARKSVLLHDLQHAFKADDQPSAKSLADELEADHRQHCKTTYMRFKRLGDNSLQPLRIGIHLWTAQIYCCKCCEQRERPCLTYI